MTSWKTRLNEAFQTSGWSKTELARRSGISYDSLNKYLAGKVENPRGDSLPRLAKALGVDADWLRDGTGPGDAVPGTKGLTQLGGHTEILVLVAQYKLPFITTYHIAPSGDIA